ARLQAEQRAAVVDQVELDVAAAAVLLERLLLRRVRLRLAPPGDRQVGVEEVVAAVAHEGEQPAEVALEAVEEDAADAARLAAVWQVEVVVAPLLEAPVVGDVGVPHADVAPDAVEVDHVL